MSELKLYNTLTRKKEIFTPLDPSNVRMYVCGPTVYDFAHIGNARPVIVFDVLFRLLRHLYGEAHVTYARNITDVDDKINARAVRDFPGLPLNEAIRKVTESTAAQFHADVKALGCLEPTYEPRATDHIGQMIDIIGRLLANGYAYIAHGAEGREVLFAVGKMPRYGELSNRKLEEQREGARVAVEPHKKSPGDFVLWKESSANEPGWNAEFKSDSEKVTIYGRPGWHIECSAMSMVTLLEPLGGGLSCDDPLKNTFDIHAGGLDLIFPHHENEIAQSCCAFGSSRMANIWMHNGFLQVEGQKMSKSLGNFVTINELLQDWPGQVLRYNMLKTHYSQPIDWRLSSLIESQAELEKFAKAADINAFQGSTILADRSDFPQSIQCDPRVIEALSDDLNTPAAISVIRQIYKDSPEGETGENINLLKTCEWLGILSSENLSQHSSEIFGQPFNFYESAIHNIRKFRIYRANGMNERSNDYSDNLRYLGYTVSSHPTSSYIEIQPSEPEWRGVIERMIAARLAAREAKNFAESDRIRDELVAMGIQIMDSKDYVSGKLQTTWEVKR